MQKIHALVRMFGGMKYAFDLEWKIRLFTIEVLDYALIHMFDSSELRSRVNLSFTELDLKVDGEKAIE